LAALLQSYAVEGISHVQVWLEPTTPAAIESFAPVLHLLDRPQPTKVHEDDQGVGADARHIGLKSTSVATSLTHRCAVDPNQPQLQAHAVIAPCVRDVNQHRREQPS
jgi:hypothetical protein